jgi:hypothetical protein
VVGDDVINLNIIITICVQQQKLEGWLSSLNEHAIFSPVLHTYSTIISQDGALTKNQLSTESRQQVSRWDFKWYSTVKQNKK